MSVLQGPPGVPGDFYPPLEKREALRAAVLLVLLPGSLGATLAACLRFRFAGQDESNVKDFKRLLWAFGGVLAGTILQPVLWAGALCLPTAWTNALAVGLQAANVTFIAPWQWLQVTCIISTQGNFSLEAIAVWAPDLPRSSYPPTSSTSFSRSASSAAPSRPLRGSRRRCAPWAPPSCCSS